MRFLSWWEKPEEAAGCGAGGNLSVQAAFRGVAIDERVLCHRPGARRGDRYRIGSVRTAHAPAPLPLLGVSFLRLIEDTPAGFRVRVTPSMRGTITVDEDAVSLQTWVEREGSSFIFPPGARACITCGEMEYRIDWTGQTARLRAPLAGLRWSEQRYTVGTGLAMLLVLLMISWIPPDARALSLQQLGRDVRLVAFRLLPLEEQRRVMTSGLSAASGGHLREIFVPAVKGPAARSGRLRVRAFGRGVAVNQEPRTAFKREQEVRASGILGLLRPETNPRLAWLFERGTALGRAEHELDGLRALGVDSHGIGGFSVRGTGVIGDGRAEATVGSARLGTVGLGPGGRPGADYGGPGGRFNRRRPRPLAVVTEQPAVRGGLDREIIRRVVRRHINEIRYCYERELLHAPTLAGRVAVRFTIAPTGLIAAAVVDSSSLDSPRVELCTVDAIRRWEFPQPRGGGIVVATYPFTFVPAGQRH